MDPPALRPMKNYTLNQLRMGYLPAPSKIETIQIDLSSLSNELARLDALIEDLSAQREKVKEDIVLRHTIISPVRRPPDDVVQAIFLACLPSRRNAVMSAQEAPLLLCRVCSMWRALALATPRLWASLHIHLGFILDDHHNAHAKLNALSDEAIRRVSTGTVDLWASMPLLRGINITGCEDFHELAGMFAAPSVRRLSAHVQLDEQHIPLLSGLRHITHISLTSFSSGSGRIFLAILKNLVHLVSLQLELSDRLPRMAAITHLPFIESLSLIEYGFNLSEAAAHLDCISMPQLAHLCLQSRVSDGALVTSLGSSSPLVENLEITLPSFSKESLSDTLRHFPSLTKFTVHDTLWQEPQPGDNPMGDLADTASLLALLTIDGATTTGVCPRLVHLEISSSHDIPPKTLSKFLQTRADAKRPF
ncbi:hypothetical protein C8R43DRAFT_957077 [Mycena crocata]|nr:hypothetical protein C8R43DRAFT_957077 [Mycena crocata]